MWAPANQTFKHSRGWVEGDADDVAHVFKVRLSYIMGFCLNKTEENEDDRRRERGTGGSGGERRVGRGRENRMRKRKRKWYRLCLTQDLWNYQVTCLMGSPSDIYAHSSPLKSISFQPVLTGADSEFSTVGMWVGCTPAYHVSKKSVWVTLPIKHLVWEKKPGWELQSNEVGILNNGGLKQWASV